MLETNSQQRKCSALHFRRWFPDPKKRKVLKDIPEKDRAAGVKLHESQLPNAKTLGVQWRMRIPSNLR